MPQIATTGPHITAIDNGAGDSILKNTGTVGDYCDPVPTILLPGKSAVRSAGGNSWADASGDRTDEITATADLATLAADGTDGDGFFGGGTFNAGEFVVLDDWAVAQYNGTNWVAGVA